MRAREQRVCALFNSDGFDFQSPVPLREIVCGDPDASSVNATVALNVPVVLGAKIRNSEQLAPAARTDPQLLVWQERTGIRTADLNCRNVQCGGTRILYGDHLNSPGGANLLGREDRRHRRKRDQRRRRGHHKLNLIRFPPSRRWILNGDGYSATTCEICCGNRRGQNRIGGIGRLREDPFHFTTEVSVKSLTVQCQFEPSATRRRRREDKEVILGTGLETTAAARLLARRYTASLSPLGASAMNAKPFKPQRTRF